jgi:Kef-type K+ transport system membrane component KefB
MRRLIILTLLFGGMQLILPLRAGGQGSQVLLTFGFLILAAYTIGEIAVTVRLPMIVGYLAAGVLVGPSVLGTVTAATMAELAPVRTLAIALIAFLAGAELRWSEVRERGATIVKILASELTLAFVALTALLLALRDFIPFLQNTTGGQLIAFSVLFAAIAIVHSPAVTMALLTETGARGPVARTTLGVVLVSDVVVVLLFTGALALARYLSPPTGSEIAAVSFGTVAWEIGGAAVIGSLLGGAVALYLRFVHRELFLFAIIVAFFGAEIARLTHVEPLLMLLTAGFVMENVSRHGEGEALRHAMERSAEPVFVVFFALAGAEMALGAIGELWMLIIPIVVVRGVAMWAGTALGARWARLAGPEARYVWMGLISQAGVAIGLASVVAAVYPRRGAMIQTLFLAVLAINQTLGPILFRHALVRSGEIDPATGQAPEESPAPPRAGEDDATGAPSESGIEEEGPAPAARRMNAAGEIEADHPVEEGDAGPRPTERTSG